MNRRGFLAGAAAAGLSGCAAEQIWAPEADVARAFTPGIGATSLTLYTMKNTGSDNGAHTGLMINASQRVIFDPAGTFAHSSLPERNDVIFGITPRVEAFYTSYHARETYYVVGQKIEVPAATAELALRTAMAYGAVPKAGCTRATSAVLRRLPGFESLPRTYFPDKLLNAFATLPGVQTWTIRENDSDDKSRALRQFPLLSPVAQ